MQIKPKHFIADIDSPHDGYEVTGHPHILSIQIANSFYDAPKAEAKLFAPIVEGNERFNTSHNPILTVGNVAEIAKAGDDNRYLNLAPDSEQARAYKREVTEIANGVIETLASRHIKARLHNKADEISAGVILANRSELTHALLALGFDGASALEIADHAAKSVGKTKAISPQELLQSREQLLQK